MRPGRLSRAKEMEHLGSAVPLLTLSPAEQVGSAFQVASFQLSLFSPPLPRNSRHRGAFWSCVCLCSGQRGPSLTPWGRAVKAEYAPSKILWGLLSFPGFGFHAHCSQLFLPQAPRCCDFLGSPSQDGQVIASLLLLTQPIPAPNDRLFIGIVLPPVLKRQDFFVTK